MIQLNRIGTVRNALTEAHHDTHWAEIESEIVVDDEWRAALDGIAEFSHIWVITYFDRMPAVDLLHIRPMTEVTLVKDDALPLVGIFATRSPQRPNPIGICAAELLEVRGNVLRVRALDALDGTLVLDLKPYLARRDAIANTRVGAWVKQFYA
jgi:tRNA (adenine37-N6)-methyltransferase